MAVNYEEKMDMRYAHGSRTARKAFHESNR
jgi:hypothetical protein